MEQRQIIHILQTEQTHLYHLNLRMNHNQTHSKNIRDETNLNNEQKKRKDSHRKEERNFHHHHQKSETNILKDDIGNGDFLNSVSTAVCSMNDRNQSGH